MEAECMVVDKASVGSHSEGNLGRNFEGLVGENLSPVNSVLILLGIE